MATLVFCLASFALLYVFFGYPCLLAFLARRRPAPILRDFLPRRVSVLLAVHNGAPFIHQKLESLHQLHYPLDQLEILVLADGCLDATESIVRNFPSPCLRYIPLPKGGKARALNEGIRLATGDILFFTDVRQPLDPNALRYLVECFADPRTGAVSGELIIRDGATLAQTNIGLYWKYEKWIRRHQSALDSVIGATGCIYALRRDLATPLPPDCLLDDVFQPLSATLQGYRVLLEDRAKAYDNPTSLDSEFRRKVRTLAGNFQLLRQLPQLLSSSNRLRFHFLSHKVGRLLAPWALLAIAASTPFLPQPLLALAAAAQIAIYGLALADPIFPERFPLKRLSSPARTFVVLMAASLAAVSFFFRSADRLWQPAPGGSNNHA